MAIRPTSQTYIGPGIDGPAGDAEVVVPTNSAATDPTARISTGIYVGGAGNVHVIFAGGTTAGALFMGVPAGTTLRVRAVRVQAANTTATNMLFLYGAN
jgi:hypothetical protein